MGRKLKAVLIVVVVLAILVGFALGAPGCAFFQNANVQQVAGWAAAIALDVDALADGGSTLEERDALREDVADALTDLSDQHPTVKAVADVIRVNGQVSQEQREAIMLALADKPVLQTLASLAVEFVGSGVFKSEDWRAAARALARWSAQR